MAKRARTRKAVDDIDQVRCKSGSYGIIREEVYVNDAAAVVKYNLAFIHLGLCQQDNGRVIGYDNAHGRHERHWMGSVQPSGFISYERTMRRYLDEVEGMKTKIGTKSFAELREHKLARARKLDRKEHIPSEKRITFATAVEMLSHITPKRVRLCEVAREKPRSITELAAVLQRDRKAVHRDVQALHSLGMLLLRKEPNPGHGQVQVVTAAASRFQLVAEV